MHFETIDEALEYAEFDDLDVAVLDRYGDVVARRRSGGSVEFPVGAFSAAESAEITLLRSKR